MKSIKTTGLPRKLLIRDQVTEKHQANRKLDHLPRKRIVDIQHYVQHFAKSCQSCENYLNIVDLTKLPFPRQKSNTLVSLSQPRRSEKKPPNNL